MEHHFNLSSEAKLICVKKFVLETNKLLLKILNVHYVVTWKNSISFSFFFKTGFLCVVLVPVLELTL